MESLNGKIDSDPGAPGFLPADEWNQSATEIENAILDAGITLSSADLTQLSQAISNYVSNGFFYTDSGTANSYVLSPVGGNRSATPLRDGMCVEFETVSPNTTASTVNLAGLGPTSILLRGGGALRSGDITGRVKLRYDLSNNRFELQNPGLSTNGSVNGYTELSSGYIIQWGLSSSLGDNASQNITLPITFPNAFLGLSATPQVSSGTSDNQSANGFKLSTSQITVSNSGDGSPFAIHYIAVGH